MKRAVAACLTLLTLAAIHSFAAGPAAQDKAVPKEEPSAKPAADAPQPVIPERKLTFDVSEEEEPVPFGTADPELLEQRYVATFSLVGTMRLASFGSMPEAYRAAVARYRFLLLGAPFRAPTQAEFKQAAREMPLGRLPSEEVMSLLTKLVRKGTPFFLRSVGPADQDTRSDLAVFHLRILAATPEQAKELVQGLLAFYDYGVFYPLQKEALTAKQGYEQRLAQDRADLDTARDEAPLLLKELDGLKEYKDITKEALVEFTTQLRLIGVDLVGIQARIDACNRILADRKSLSPSRIDQVETVKVTAEIELVGLAARKAAIEEIVKKGGRREELLRKYDRASSRVRTLESEISRIQEEIASCENALKKCMPYPVKDGKIVIRRIKWVSPGGRGSGPPSGPESPRDP